jgi:hypothetical protein
MKILKTTMGMKVVLTQPLGAMSTARQSSTFSSLRPLSALNQHPHMKFVTAMA